MNKQVALVAGAGSFDGNQIARLAAEAGFDLLIADDGAALYATLADCLHYGGEVIPLEIDVMAGDAFDRLLERLGARHLDIICAVIPPSRQVAGEFEASQPPPPKRTCDAIGQIVRTPLVHDHTEILLVQMEEDNRNAPNPHLETSVGHLAASGPIAVTTVHGGRIDRRTDPRRPSALIIECGSRTSSIETVALAWKSLQSGAKVFGPGI